MIILIDIRGHGCLGYCKGAGLCWLMYEDGIALINVWERDYIWIDALGHDYLD